jgi:hypothetical protein
MSFVPPDKFLCDRGREWISLRLDGELSELAQKMLDSHVGRCADCRAFAASIEQTTAELRAFPLEQPSRPFMISRQRRRAIGLGSISAVAASVAAVAVGLGALLHLPSSSPSFRASGPLIVIAQASSNNDLSIQHEHRVAQLKSNTAPARRPHGPQAA